MGGTIVNAIDYYGVQDSNVINHYKVTATRYDVAATCTEEAKNGFNLQELILYEGVADVKQHSGISRIIERYIKQLVEQGNALVFYKGQRIYSLCYTSKLRDEGSYPTFSEILNQGYEIRMFYDQPSNYLFYDYRHLGW